MKLEHYSHRARNRIHKGRSKASGKIDRRKEDWTEFVHIEEALPKGMGNPLTETRTARSGKEDVLSINDRPIVLSISTRYSVREILRA